MNRVLVTTAEQRVDEKEACLLSNKIQQILTSRQRRSFNKFQL